MPKPKLSVVDPDTVPEPPKKPKTIVEAVDDGTERDVLVAMRALLARKIKDGEVSSNSLASVSKEIRELDRQIRMLDQREEQEAAENGGEVEDSSFDASAI